MKALSIRQPWATLIAAGAKNVENRTWSTSWRGPLAIHAALRWDRGAELDPLVEWAWPALAGPAAEAYPAPDAPAFAARGVIVAVARLVDCHRSERACCWPWGSEASFHWVLADVRALSRPVAASGALGLWTPPPAVLDAVEGQL